MNEIELNRLGDSRFQLETQVTTLESAHMNAETMAAMKKASDALKVIHGNMWVFPVSLSNVLIIYKKQINNRTLDKVDTTINALNEQRELANEIAEAIANPVNLDIDEVCSSRVYSSSIITDFFLKDELKQELEDLQQDELNERLNQADHVPVHQPPTAKKEDGKFAVVTPYSCVYMVSDETLLAVRSPVEDDEEAQLKALQAELAM